jgi:hypothetical protein
MPLASSSSAGNRWAERKPIIRRRIGEPPSEARPPAVPSEPDAGDGPDPEAPAGPRSGEIGPVRREIIFEPLHERPAPVPVEPGPATPETRPEQPAEPVPAGQ